jgi:hypothetical protein
LYAVGRSSPNKSLIIGDIESCVYQAEASISAPPYWAAEIRTAERVVIDPPEVSDVSFELIRLSILHVLTSQPENSLLGYKRTCVNAGARVN